MMYYLYFHKFKKQLQKDHENKNFCYNTMKKF